MGERLRLPSGLLVAVHIHGSGTQASVIAQAEDGPATREYDVRYAESIATFEAAWCDGVRGEQIVPLIPLTGAEVFMAHLTCEVLSGPARSARRIPSKRVGGSGTEWRVGWRLDWRLDDPGDRMIRVSDSPGNSVTLPL